MCFIPLSLIQYCQDNDYALYAATATDNDIYLLIDIVFLSARKQVVLT